jgi:probable phosphoglycerate mutase
MKHSDSDVSSLARLCLVRHGETPWNIERRLQGHRDIDLNASGRQQAQAAALWLAREPIDALYASDLRRAWHTAEAMAVALSLPRQAVPELRERRCGIFEGLTHAEAAAAYPGDFARMQARDPDFVPPGGGESLVGFYLRVIAALQGIAARHPGQTVVVVTHGGVLDLANRFVRRVPLSAPRDFAIPNAGLNWLSVRGGAWQIEGWGEVAHLADLSLDEL